MIDATRNGATILIVDDNPENLNILMDYLTDLGFNTLIAKSGEAALMRLLHVRPDIILLDVMMPGLGGFETCRLLKRNEDFRDIPVIFVTALTDAVDKVTGFEAGAVDYITKPFQHEEVLARINAHLTIQRQKDELAQLNATKDKFFSIIAHDIRGPLGSIVSVTRLMSMMMERLSMDEIIDMISDLNDTVENTMKLLENLLDWSRHQNGVMEFQPESVDISALIADNVKLFQNNAGRKNIRIHFPENHSANVHADPKMTHCILRNLITNAIKFTRFDGEITIATKPNKEVVEVSISDNGIGMNASKLKNIFRIDCKTQTEGTSGEKGTGLGLILCKEFIDKHNGRIWAESEPGKGTSFRFTLPSEFNGNGEGG